MAQRPTLQFLQERPIIDVGRKSIGYSRAGMLVESDKLTIVLAHRLEQYPSKEVNIFTRSYSDSLLQLDFLLHLWCLLLVYLHLSL